MTLRAGQIGGSHIRGGTGRSSRSSWSGGTDGTIGTGRSGGAFRPCVTTAARSEKQ